jgi:xylan 1,4-beta-xylosidase
MVKPGKCMVDKSKNKTDVPHDYIELKTPAKARYLKITNLHMPTGKFALSGFRVFGKGAGAAPDTVRNLIVLRGNAERRNSWIRWRQTDGAVGYTIYMGTEPDKLYNNIMVYNVNEYYFNGMEKGLPYYFPDRGF